MSRLCNNFHNVTFSYDYGIADGCYNEPVLCSHQFRPDGDIITIRSVWSACQVVIWMCDLQDTQPAHHSHLRISVPLGDDGQEVAYAQHLSAFKSVRRKRAVLETADTAPFLMKTPGRGFSESQSYIRSYKLWKVRSCAETLPKLGMIVGPDESTRRPVSYTHLTLPTKRIV